MSRPHVFGCEARKNRIFCKSQLKNVDFRQSQNAV